MVVRLCAGVISNIYLIQPPQSQFLKLIYFLVDGLSVAMFDHLWAGDWIFQSTDWIFQVYNKVMLLLE